MQPDCIAACPHLFNGALSEQLLACHEAKTGGSKQAYDEAKNKRLSGGDDFQVKLVGPGGHETHASLEDQDDGTYTVTYCVTAAGIHDLHVTLGEHCGV